MAQRSSVNPITGAVMGGGAPPPSPSHSDGSAAVRSASLSRRTSNIPGLSGDDGGAPPPVSRRTSDIRPTSNPILGEGVTEATTGGKAVARRGSETPFGVTTAQPQSRSAAEMRMERRRASDIPRGLDKPMPVPNQSTYNLLTGSANAGQPEPKGFEVYLANGKSITMGASKGKVDTPQKQFNIFDQSPAPAPTPTPPRPTHDKNKSSIDFTAMEQPTAAPPAKTRSHSLSRNASSGVSASVFNSAEAPAPSPEKPRGRASVSGVTMRSEEMPEIKRAPSKINESSLSAGMQPAVAAPEAGPSKKPPPDPKVKASSAIPLGGDTKFVDPRAEEKVPERGGPCSHLGHGRGRKHVQPIQSVEQQKMFTTKAKVAPPPAPAAGAPGAPPPAPAPRAAPPPPPA